MILLIRVLWAFAVFWHTLAFAAGSMNVLFAYRAMFGGRVESWNLRDTHMMETLQALVAHTRDTAGSARAVVWAHNSHLGDARATQMGDSGELNLGQLVRQAYGAQAAQKCNPRSRGFRRSDVGHRSAFCRHWLDEDLLDIAVEGGRIAAIGPPNCSRTVIRTARLR